MSKYSVKSHITLTNWAGVKCPWTLDWTGLDFEMELCGTSENTSLLGLDQPQTWLKGCWHSSDWPHHEPITTLVHKYCKVCCLCVYIVHDYIFTTAIVLCLSGASSCIVSWILWVVLHQWTTLHKAMLLILKWMLYRNKKYFGSWLLYDGFTNHGKLGPKSNPLPIHSLLHFPLSQMARVFFF